MKINIGLTEEARTQISTSLNQLLADEYILYTKTRQYHWNVGGIQFQSLHSFFEEQYNALNEIIDDIAERARALGLKAKGSLKHFLELTRIEEDNNEEQNTSAKTMLANLLKDHEAIIQTLRADIETIDDKYNDEGTVDFLTSLMENHEKMAWMLRAHLEE